jgi:hypothetical protein
MLNDDLFLSARDDIDLSEIIVPSAKIQCLYFLWLRRKITVDREVHTKISFLGFPKAIVTFGDPVVNQPLFES